jgi:hypothetical protein
MSTLIDHSRCPACGAVRGEECSPENEGTHSARIHEFIMNGSFLARRDAHMESCAAMKAVGVSVDERYSLFLTDEEILGIYG